MKHRLASSSLEKALSTIAQARQLMQSSAARRRQVRERCLALEQRIAVLLAEIERLKQP